MHKFLALGLAFFGANSSVVQADATLVYQLQDTGTEVVDKKLSLARFFVRVDSSDEEGKYLLFQAGKFFPLYSVNEKGGTYTLLTPPVKATLHPITQTEPPAKTASADADLDRQTGEASDTEPTQEIAEQDRQARHAATEEPSKTGDVTETRNAAPAHDLAQHEPSSEEPLVLAKAPQFKPTKKTDEVAGVRCRTILELIDGQPAIEHCMANKAALGITERETRTLSRLLVMARARGYDWLGAASKDEDFVSVRSRDLVRGKALTLKSVSTQALPAGYLRVPRDFKEVGLEPAAEPANGDAAAAAKD